MSETPAKHLNIGPIEWLLGKWRSTEAKVFYPTMPTTVFFNEEFEFSHEGQPILVYRSKTKHAEKGNVLHMDSGFLRFDPATKKVAFVVAHNFGISEISEGEISDKKIKLESKSISRMSFTEGSEVTQLLRVWERLDDDTLSSVVSMGTVTQPLQEHFRVLYKRL